MAKHASKFAALQVLEPPRTTSVQVPLPMLNVLANAHNAFFDLCVDVGRQVFSALLGIDADGTKHVLGLREGTTENRQVAKELLRDSSSEGSIRSERGYSSWTDRRPCAPP